MLFQSSFAILCCLAFAPLVLAGGPTVSGEVAALRNGINCAPARAPVAVGRAIRAANRICRKLYRWGGGRGAFDDRGYDCSGTVSFLLHHAGLIETPIPSRELMSYGAPGCGRWIAIDARKGHVFAVVCGLRLDTTGFREHEGPRWRSEPRSLLGFT